jgi:acetyl esterase/lipase
MLAMDHEGRQVAEWLNSLGIDAFILKYRLAPRYHHPATMEDAQRALRYVRAHARELGIAPDRIGIWGFSAGGHLASTAATHFDAGNPSAIDTIERASSRPDFAILAYPVITCSEWFKHEGSCRNLLGDNHDQKLAAYLSNEKQVTAQTPPTFLFHTNDDEAVPAENSVAFYMALRKARVAAELHIYEHGPHGVGLAPKDPVLSSWPQRLADWLRVRGLLSPGTAPTHAAKTP